MAPYKFSKKNCQEWRQDRNTNPKTGYTIDPKASNGVFKKLKKQCNVYEELAIKTRRLSLCRSRNKKLRKELMSSLEKVRTVIDAPMSKKDAEKSVMATSPTLNAMQPIIEQEMASYDPQHMKYALRVIKFMYSIVDDSYPQLTFGEMKRMGDTLIQKLEEKAEQMSSPSKDQVYRVISMLKFYMGYIERHWSRFMQKDADPAIIAKDQGEIEDVSEDDDMAIVPYQPNKTSANASSMGIVQYTNASRANSSSVNSARISTPRANSANSNNTLQANTLKEKTPERLNTPSISAKESSRSVSRRPKSPPLDSSTSSVSSWMTYAPESMSAQNTTMRKHTSRGMTNTLPVTPPVSIVDFTSTQKRARSPLKTAVLQLEDYDMDKMLLLLDELGISKQTMKSTLTEKRSRVNALYDYIERHWDRFKQEIDAQDSKSVSPFNTKSASTKTVPRLSQEELQDYNRDTFMTILAFFGLSSQDLQDVDLIDVRKEFKRKANASASPEDRKKMDQLLAYIDRHWDRFKQDARERIVTGSSGSFKSNINSMAAAGSSETFSSNNNRTVKNPLYNSSSAAKSANKSARVTQSMNTNPLFNALNTASEKKNSKK